MLSLRVGSSAFFLLGLFAVANAHAGRAVPHLTRKYALRDVRVEGNATPAEKKLLEERILTTVELLIGEKGNEMAHTEEVTAALYRAPHLKSCFDVRCGAELGDMLKADKILSIGVERSGAAGKGDWMVRVWHFDVRSLKVGASVDLPCKACDAQTVVGDLSHSLGPALQTEAGTMCTVKVTSKPEGAVVALSGTPVGVTPFQHTVMPGKHKISVEKEGFSHGEDEVDCPPGSMQNMSFALTPGGGSVHQEAPPKRSPVLKIVGATLIVLGAAGVAAGAAELYLDGKGTCTLAAGQTQCKEVYDTKTIGGALVGVGAAGIVAGIVTLVVDGVRGKPSKVTADVRLGPSSGFVGVRGSF
jgi:hypothetical protein